MTYVCELRLPTFVVGRSSPDPEASPGRQVISTSSRMLKHFWISTSNSTEIIELKSWYDFIISTALMALISDRVSMPKKSSRAPTDSLRDHWDDNPPLEVKGPKTKKR
ncbi:hypothetical protein GW17_00026198 [Ensete ventricosum]|nr:hypothetical protein GW17_00026198 [Ensete ventricosum]